MAINISLSSEDVSVFQRIYSENSEAVGWMLKFGNPIERRIAEIIKIANEGKTEVDLQVLRSQEGLWNVSKRS